MAKQKKSVEKTKTHAENSPSNVSMAQDGGFNGLPDRSSFYLLGLLFLLLLYGYFRYNFLNIPLERDEGSYGYIGQLLLDGKIPYKDFYEMKPPALYYSYALLVGLFGSSTAGLHAAILVLCLASAALIYFIANKLFPKGAALLAALVYLQFSFSPGASGYTAQAEHIVVFYLLLALFFLTKTWDGAKAWHWLAAGIFLGNAFMTKQIAAVFAPAALALIWYSTKKSYEDGLIKRVLLHTALFGLGAALMVGCWLLLVLAKGSWNEMMFWLFQYPKAYASVFSWAERRNEFWTLFAGFNKDYWPLWLLGYFGVLSGFLFKKESPYSALAPLLFLGAIIAILPGYYFYGHYWLYLAPALGLCAAAGISALSDKLQHTWPMAKNLSLVVLALIFILDFSKRKEYYLSPNFKIIMRQAYSDNPFPEADIIGAKIKKMARPGDQLIVMGSEPQLNFTTQLRSPTRHFFMGYLTKGRAEEAEWIKEAKQEISTAKPRFMVIVMHPYSWAYFDNVKRDMFEYGFQTANQSYKLIGVADMQPNGTKYLWEDAAKDFQVGTGKSVLVYERKDQ